MSVQAISRFTTRQIQNNKQLLAMRTSFLFLLMLTGASAATAQTDRSEAYVSTDDMPNGVRYLPVPADTASAAFFNDWRQYHWGKSLRHTPRGQQAVTDAKTDAKTVLEGFSPAFGIELSKENTPEVFELIDRTISSCSNATSKAKNHYMRRRPFVVMNEPTTTPDAEPYLRVSGSYPSGHTALGWATALILVELNPDRQDTILARGYEYGQSRVIVGAHWQSDIEAGRSVGSAAYARLHADSRFLEQLRKAKKEVDRKLGKQKK